jgi:hypothetical protein
VTRTGGALEVVGGSVYGPGFSHLAPSAESRVKKLGSSAGYLTFVRVATARVKKPALAAPAVS